MQTELLRHATARFGADPFGVRALAGITAYGLNRPFVGAWVQGRSPFSALIGRTESALTLCGTFRSAAARREFGDFLDMVGYGSLVVPAGLLSARDLPNGRLYRSGVIMTQVGAFSAAAQNSSELRAATARELTALLTACPSPWLETGDPDALYTDLSHRLRHDCIRSAAQIADGVPVACALTTAETDTAAVIGGVACRPEFRGRGYAAQALLALCIQLNKARKAIYLFTGAELVGFYQKCGFQYDGEWQEFRPDICLFKGSAG